MVKLPIDDLFNSFLKICLFQPFGKEKGVEVPLTRTTSLNLILIFRLVKEGILEPLTKAEFTALIVPALKQDEQIRNFGIFRLTTKLLN